MEEKIMYPRNTDDLLVKVANLISIYSEEKEKIEYINLWKKWFDDNNIKEKITNSLGENEFMKPYYEIPDKYGIQVWVKEKEYNKIVYNLIANYEDEFTLPSQILLPK